MYPGYRLDTLLDKTTPLQFYAMLELGARNKKAEILRTTTIQRMVLASVLDKKAAEDLGKFVKSLEEDLDEAPPEITGALAQKISGSII